MVKVKLSRASARQDFCSVSTDSYFFMVKLVVLVHRVSTRHDKPTTAPILADEQKHFCCQRRENVLFSVVQISVVYHASAHGEDWETTNYDK